MRALVIWAGVVLAMSVPLGLSAASPLLQWRDPVYILAGLTGVLGLVFLLVQPLLIGGFLPGITARRARVLHRSVGILLLGAVLIHVISLWITSPPDVVDALLFASPTPFSVWGVIAMWAVFASAVLAGFRRRIGLTRWRRLHKSLAAVIVAGTCLHALLIVGTMESYSKLALCILVSACALWVLFAPKGKVSPPG